MSGDHPLAAAWTRVRNVVGSTAATYREEGREVVEVVADHATVRGSDDPVTLSFTVPGDAADELAAAVDDDATYRTEVQYVDVDGTRLFVLEVRAPEAPVVLLAGGVGHDSLRPHASDPDAPARTLVRRVDGGEAAQFGHERVAPFVDKLG
ncbi:DUF7529 family protein [Halolamina salina]|uniref:Uncharacterized protein n=1 Tax=Halolamina salina TaxID=1220023 RepID=A0ABD6B802_9EURY